AGGVDAPAKGSAGKAEDPRDPRVGEPDRGLAIRRHFPEPRLVVGHEEVPGLVEHEVVPHRRVPAEPVERRRRLREELWGWSVAKTVVSPIAGRVDSLARAGVIAGTNTIAPTTAMVRNFINSPPGPCFRSPDKTVASRPTDRSEGNRQVEAGESLIPDGEEVV